MARAFLTQLLVTSVLCLTGCGGSSTCNSTTSTNSSCTTTSTVTITLHPSTTTEVPLGATLQITADVSGTSNTALTWQVNGHDGGNSTVGTISSSGLYTPPATVPSPSEVAVTAISKANTNDEANVSLVIVSGVSITVSPTAADLLPGKSQQFTSTLTGNSNTNVTWAVAGVAGGNSTVGTITSQGLYTAPSTLSRAPQSIAISATSAVDATKIANASVTLHNNVSVSLSPSSASLKTFGQQQFTASVASDPNAAFSWSVHGLAGGNTTYGTIVDTVDSSGVHHGVYTAPNHVPTITAVSGTNLASGGAKTTPLTIMVVYQADSYFSASAIVTITSPNQNAQALPTPLGVSGGNANDSGSGTCCGGTLGALVSRGGQQYILSNSHVLARTDLGALGDSIIQPGLFDSSCSTAGTNVVATLSQFVDLESSSSGAPVDAALALVSSGKVDSSGTILQLGATTTGGQPTDAPPHAGNGVVPSLYEPDGVTPLKVAKSGRATGLTCSSVGAINVTAAVTFQKGCGSGAQFQQTYNDLVLVEGGDFSAQGDSGALVVTQDTADPVALLFASSDTASLGSPVSDVLTALADPSTTEKPVFVGSTNTHIVAACNLPGAQSLVSSASHALDRGPSTQDLELAIRTRDSHASLLLAHPEVLALGVGASLDSLEDAAIILFVRKGTATSTLPKQVDGVRIRIVEIVESLSTRGIVSAQDSQVLADGGTSGQTIRSPSAHDIAQARLIHEKTADGLMHLSGVQAVGITASADGPGEAALVVYLVRGKTHDAIPQLVDGMRTVIRESSPFRVGFGTSAARSACSPLPGMERNSQVKR
jgi:hypothetical protein